jgi:hypothetical protein
MNLLLISMKFCRIMISCLMNRSSHRNISSYIESMSQLHLKRARQRVIYGNSALALVS